MNNVQVWAQQIWTRKEAALTSNEQPSYLKCAALDFYLQRKALMQQNYTAVIKQDGGWWIGWIEEVPGVNCQESSREALVETLRVTLREALKLNRQEALGAAGGDFEEASIAV